MQWIRRFSLSMLVVPLIALLASVSAAFAQAAAPAPAASAASSSTSEGIRQEGSFMTAPIVLDGATLFRIATPANPSPGQPAITARVDAIETALEEITATTGTGLHATTIYAPGSFKVQRVRAGDQVVLQAVDAKHPQPLTILTVTPVDAQEHQTSVETLAALWQGTLQQALEQALEKRQPSSLRSNLELVARVAIALVIASILVSLIVAALNRRIARLTASVNAHAAALAAEQTEPTATEAAPHERRRRFRLIALSGIEPEQRLTLFRALTAALVWLVLLGWFGATTWALFLFPQTTPLGHTLARGALGVAVIWIVTGLLNRLLDVVITRIAAALKTHRAATSDDETARELLRIPTITRAISGFKAFLLVFSAVLATLSQIGVPVGSVVTVGGLAAIGISLAAQNFVRDFMNGFLVLFEDQYVVGDFITINTHTGLVEHLSLRMVQIRDGAGSVVTIPHSAVTTVMNLSRNWSRVDYRVPVDPAADVAAASASIRRVIEGLATEPEYREAILQPIEWMGIDALSRDGIVMRVSVKTAPLRQFDVRREINARVCKAFSDAGIGFGAPLPEAAS